MTRAASTPTRLTWVTTLIAVLALTGCSGGSGGTSSDSSTKPASPVEKLTVTSPAFTEGKPIPTDNTCKGTGAFPEISWTGDLAQAKSVAVIVDDPDAPSGTFYHLVALDLPATTTKLSDPMTSRGTLAPNSGGGLGWTSPCPPSGTHHYRFTVYGLSAPTKLGDDATPEDALTAIKSKRVAEGRLTGLVSA